MSDRTLPKPTDDQRAVAGEIADLAAALNKAVGRAAELDLRVEIQVIPVQSLGTRWSMPVTCVTVSAPMEAS